jgi:Putative DNA-binding domain
MRSIGLERTKETFRRLAHLHRYRFADIRLARLRLSGEIRVVSGSCRFSGSDEEGVEPTTYDYGELVLHRSSVPTTVAQRLANSLTQKRAFIDLPPLSRVRLQGRWDWGFNLGSGERFVHAQADWPTTVVRVTLDDPTGGGNLLRGGGPLFGAGPLYPDASEAVGHFVVGHNRADPSAQYAGYFQFLFPDNRARIERAIIEDDGICFRIERRSIGSRARLAVDVFAVSSAGVRQGVVRVNDRLAQFDAGGMVSRLLAHLTSEKGEVLDEIGTGLGLPGFGGPLDPRVQPSHVTLELEVQAAIAAGEGPQTEFKEVVPTKDGGMKMVRTMTAYANQRGGMIIIGIADDMTVKGHPFDERDRIANIVATHAEGQVEFEIVRLDVGKPLTMIRVPPGLRPPYLMRDGTTWVRVGSTTRVATSADIQRMIAPRTTGLDTTARDQLARAGIFV